MMYTKDIQKALGLTVTTSFDGEGFKVLRNSDGWLTERTYETKAEAQEWIQFMYDNTIGKELTNN